MRGVLVAGIALGPSLLGSWSNGLFPLETRPLLRILATLGAAYEQLTGTKSTVRTHVPWLRSMRGERPHEQKRIGELSPLELILVTTVVVVVVLFEVWFFFFSGSSIGGSSGR